jgi:hypothetical protein
LSVNKQIKYGIIQLVGFDCIWHVSEIVVGEIEPQQGKSLFIGSISYSEGKLVVIMDESGNRMAGSTGQVTDTFCRMDVVKPTAFGCGGEEGLMEQFLIIFFINPREICYVLQTMLSAITVAFKVILFSSNYCSEKAQTHITSFRCFSPNVQINKIREYWNTVLKICMCRPFLVESEGGLNCVRLMSSDQLGY